MFKLLRSSIAVAVLALPLVAVAKSDGYGMPARNWTTNLPVVKVPAVSFSFKGDARISGFHNPAAGQNPASTTGGEVSGFQELAHLGAAAKLDNGTSFHAGVILEGGNWTGLRHQPNTAPTSQTTTNALSKGPNSVRLDYAWVTVPMGNGFTFSAGRKLAGWADGFTSADTRRDRLFLSKVVHGWFLFDLWDKRNAGTTDKYDIPTSDYHSAYLWIPLGVVKNFNLGGMTGNHVTVGAFYGLYRGATQRGADVVTSSTGCPTASTCTVGAPGTYLSDFALRGVDEFSPWAKGTVNGYHFLAAYNYFGHGQGSVFYGSSSAWALRLGHDLGSQFNLAGQYVGVQNGGYVGPGFDTFSSVINNSPDMDQSPTNITNIGGLGGIGPTQAQQFKQYLVMLRLSWMPAANWTFNLAGGRMHRDGGYIAGFGTSPGNAFSGTENDNVYDVQAHYQVTSNAMIWASYGVISPTGSGQALMEQGTGLSGSLSAVSLNLRAQF